MNVVIIGFFAASVALAAQESTYCAFEVRVSAPSGVPRSKVPVMLIRNKTAFSETVTDANGLARLCDAPLEEVDIAVGFDVCGLVIVHNLHSLWPETKRVFVTFAENPCNHFVPSPYCQVLLRIQDRDGRPVAGARFDEKSSSKSSGPDSSDHLGRLFRLAGRHARLEGVVRTRRGQSAPISFECTDDVELKVVVREP